MTGQSPQAPPPEIPRSSSLSRALLASIMAAVLYGALLVCCYGFISLLSGRDVITESDVGPLVGPTMAAVACILVFFSVLGSLRPRPNRSGLPWARAILTAFLVYLGGPIVGGAIVAFGRTDAVSALLFFGESVVGPFVICSAILALPIVLITPLVALRGR